MTKVRVGGFSVSLNGFGAGLDQSLENPLAGVGWNCIAGCSAPACSGP